MGDGPPDTFRIKSQSEDKGVETVVCDYGTDQAAIGGGSVIHSGGASAAAANNGATTQTNRVPLP